MKFLKDNPWVVLAWLWELNQINILNALISAKSFKKRFLGF